MCSYILTFVSEDKSGLVAGVSRVLFEKGFNIKDSSCTRLAGIFTMTLIVEHEEAFEESALKALFPCDFAPQIFFPDEKSAPLEEEEEYTVTAYGADKPGIVYAVSKVLAAEGINIIDLQTAQNKLYVMILQVLVPKSASPLWLEKVAEAARAVGIEASIRKLEDYGEL